MGGRRLTAGLMVVIALALPLLAGCAGGGEKPAEASSFRIDEKDFKISAPKTLPAGQVELEVYNQGPVAHALGVVRGTTKDLPISPDGITVDNEKIANRTVGGMAPSPEGEYDVEVDLKPGRYVFICNMNGHYRAGMHTEVVVR